MNRRVTVDAADVQTVVDNAGRADHEQDSAAVDHALTRLRAALTLPERRPT